MSEDSDRFAGGSIRDSSAMTLCSTDRSVQAGLSLEDTEVSVHFGSGTPASLQSEA